VIARDQSNKVVVLDRDGTLVIDREYLSDPAGLEFMPGAAEGLRQFHDLGYRLVVATNQSGIGRGFFSEDQLHAVHERLDAMVRAAGAQLAGIYYCPHAPDAGCSCRKPETGLLLRAARELGFEPSAAIVIGDKPSDVEFGQRAGATTILLAAERKPTLRATPRGSARTADPDFIVRDFLQAAQTIQQQERRSNE
jgi:D-glycero-D-manno-heptose 1,7-bisphosphate phosphatase